MSHQIIIPCITVRNCAGQRAQDSNEQCFDLFELPPDETGEHLACCVPSLSLPAEETGNLVEPPPKGDEAIEAAEATDLQKKPAIPLSAMQSLQRGV